MSQKSISVLVLVFFFLGGGLAYASDVIINEFVSHPNSGEQEWVELLNTTGSPIDLTGWKLTELSSPGTNPTENDLLSLSGTIDNVLVFEIGSSKLNDTGDSIGLYNGTTLINRVTYGTDSTVKNYSINLAAPGIGKSGALISNVWETNQDSTKNTQNPNSPLVPPADNSSSSGSSSSSSGSSSSTNTQSEPKIKIIENPTMKVKILANALAFTGEPFEIKTNITGFFNENVVLGKAYWNFGDGGSLEQINNFEKFSHIYYYPGEYVLFLEYFQNSFSKTPEATSKMIIKVLPTTVTISKVGDTKDFFIELSNNAGSDIDISNWVINANGKIFILPKNSMIMSKKQMTISSKITGFSYGDQNNLKLYSGTGELVFDYNAGTTAKTVSVKITDVPHLDSKRGTSVTLASASENLSASVIDSKVPEENTNNSYSSSSSIFPFISILFIGTSASAVYFIRRKKVIPQTGNDFEILDE